MTDTSSHRRASPCPWCGPGSQLSLRADGIGGQALWCLRCGCKGPSVSIAATDLSEADAATLRRWSKRAKSGPPIDPDVLARLFLQMKLSAMLAGGADHGDGALPVKLDDLRHLIRAAGGPDPAAASPPPASNPE